MATALNVDVLTQMGFAVPDAATGNDLVVAIRLEPEAGDDALDGALAAVAAALSTRSRAPARPRSRRRARPPPRSGPRPARSRWCRCPARTPSSRRWTPWTPGTT